MKVIVAAAGLLALLLGHPAGAFTVEVLPGSAPQSTTALSYFPQPIGIVFREDDGTPMRQPVGWVETSPVLGEPRVFFSRSENTIFRIFGDVNGVAFIPAVAGPIPGTVILRVFLGFNNSLYPPVDLPPLEILPGGPVSLEWVDGNNQFVQAGHDFYFPWKVRALDAQGRPAPNAAVHVRALSSSGPSATLSAVYPRADADGVATSVLPHAENITGVGTVTLCLFDGTCTAGNFTVTNYPVAARASFETNMPSTLETGSFAMAPFVVRATDGADHGVPGVGVTFETDGCGTFDQSSSLELQTDAAGYVTSPLFKAELDGFCTVWVYVDGIPSQPLTGVPMFAYDPDTVRIQGATFVHAVSNHTISIPLKFFADDPAGGEQPIYPMPVQVRVVAAKNGASATFTAVSGLSYVDNDAVVELLANKKAGVYLVAVTRGPITKWIVVDQRKH